MDMGSVFGNWLPLGIFLAELTVVTLSTIRIIFVSRGQKTLAACLGFFEILLWLFAIGQIMKNLDSPLCHLAFAGGFTMGNYLGVWLEGVLAMGKLAVKIVSPQVIDPLVEALSARGFGLTVMEGMGKQGPVQVINMIINRRDMDRVSDMVKTVDPLAFYAVSEIQDTERGVFPASQGMVQHIYETIKRSFIGVKTIRAHEIPPNNKAVGWGA